MVTQKEMLLALGGFDETFKVAADYDLITRALLSGKRPVQVNEVFVAFRVGGISEKQNLCAADENIQIMATNYGIPLKKAEHFFENAYVSLPLFKKLLAQTVDFPNPEKAYQYNKKRFFTVVRRLLFTLRLHQGKRLIRLFGITLYKEEKYAK